MANIVGLGSTQDALGGGQRRLRDGQQLIDGSVIKQPALKPVAAPVETYARPAQAPINHDLASLAEGLASLNPALSAYAAGQKKTDKEVDKDQVAIAFAGKSPEEIDQVIKTNPLFQKAVNAQYGGELQARKQADADTSWWVNHLNTGFDFQNGDFNKEFDEFAAKRTLEFGPNKGYASSYMEQMAGSKNSLMQQVLKKRAEIAQGEQQQTTQDGMASIVRQAVNTGQTQESLLNTVSNFVRNNKDISRLPYKEQQQFILAGLDPLLNDMDQRPEMRDKIYDAVNTILTAPRKGEDGVERRLIDAPQGVGDAYKGKLADFAKKRDDLNNRYLTEEKTKWDFNAQHDPQSFTDQQLDEWNKAHNYTYTPSQIESLKLKRANSLKQLADKGLDMQAQEKADAAKATVTQQDLQSLENLDFLNPKDAEVPGKRFYRDNDHTDVQTVTADQRRQGVIEAYRKKLDFAENQMVNSGKYTKEQAQQWRMGQEIGTFSQNGMVPDDWKKEINAGANQLTTAAQTASKEMPQGAVKAFERYKLLKAQAPNLLSQVADQRARDIFDTAMEVDGDSTDQLRTGISYYANRDEKRDSVTDKQVQKALDDLKPGFWKRNLGDLWGSEPPDNMEQLRDPITKRARILVQTQHLTAEDAVAKAAKSLRTSYAVVNGTAVSTNDHRLPPNFEPLAEKYIKDLTTLYGPARFGAQSASDLTLAPMDNGGFQIVNKRHGYMSEGVAPITWKDGTNRDARFLTPDMIQDLAVEQRQKAELKATRASENRLKPLFVIPGTTLGVSRPNLSGYTPEEMQTIQKNIDEAATPAPAGSNKGFVDAVKSNNPVEQAPPRAPAPNPFKPSIKLRRDH